MCFGVRDAIALALKESAPSPLTILGDLVHNETVLSDLRARGISIKQELVEVTTPTVMITAHGTSQRRMDAIKRSGLNLLEATCPLVKVAHEAIVGLAEQGFHPIIIGQREHVEVRGLTGDLREFDVVLNEGDVLALAERDRFGIAAQTTQPIARVEGLVGMIRRRFPRAEVRFIDTVCRPTKQRQTAAEDLARRSDVVVVIGGAHSNNTRELTMTCRRHCARVHQVTSTGDLRIEWFADAETVGVTAGTSTPDSVIEEVQAWLERLKQAAPVHEVACV